MSQGTEGEVVVGMDESAQAEILKFEAAASTEVAMIPLGSIEKSDVALRGVKRNTPAFLQLVESIRQVGVLNSILVRVISVDAAGNPKYGLIDGLQRFTASLDAGKETIPARIVKMDDAAMLEAQIMTNVQRVVTRPAELSKHLLRMLARDPMLTKPLLAERLCVSMTWLDQRLSLSKLKPELQQHVDSGQMNLTNAYALSKLPQEQQELHLQAALTDQPRKFVADMKAVMAANKKAEATGKDDAPVVFQPTAHLRKMSVLKDTLAALEADEDSELVAVLKTNGVTWSDRAKAAVKLALAWVLSFDPASQATQKAEFDARETARKEKAALRKADLEKKRKELQAEREGDITKL